LNKVFLFTWSAQPSILTEVTVMIILRPNPGVKDLPWPGIELQSPSPCPVVIALSYSNPLSYRHCYHSSNLPRTVPTPNFVHPIILFTHTNILMFCLTWKIIFKWLFPYKDSCPHKCNMSFLRSSTFFIWKRWNGIEDSMSQWQQQNFDKNCATFCDVFHLSPSSNISNLSSYNIQCLVWKISPKNVGLESLRNKNIKKYVWKNFYMPETFFCKNEKNLTDE